MPRPAPSRQFPVRAPRDGDEGRCPVYVVWEITLACNLRCAHCGSRAGRPRAAELSTAECLALIDELHALGTREITLIGGEAFLRRDWLALVERIAQRGMLCGLQTGGRNLDEATIAAAARAGLRAAGVSIDGPPEIHDRLRGVPGSHAHAIRVLKAFRRHGLSATVNTQINARNAERLREIMTAIVAAGATAWQLQLTVATGNAADDPELLLQPFRLKELMPLLAELHREAARHGLRLQPGNNIGYFGPYEAIWRSVTGRVEYYGGCHAGRTALGIEADGTIKGCPSLPTRDYAGGNVRDTPLAEIWARAAELSFMRAPERSRARLSGYCRACYYADICRGGCTWTAHALGRGPGNNPYCHYRVLRLAERGWRERIVQRRHPEGRPFDYGEFDILVEDAAGRVLDQTVYESEPAVPLRGGGLELCEACRQFVHAGADPCPHCRAPRTDSGDADALYARTAFALQAWQEQIARVSARIARLRTGGFNSGESLENY